MKKEKELINFSQFWSIGSILIVVILFLMELSHIIGLGLGSTNALIAASTYILIPTIISLILTFIFNKFKFIPRSFYKFWFWMMLITLISYMPNLIKYNEKNFHYNNFINYFSKKCLFRNKKILD